MASGDAVEQIKEKITIEEVVAPYVELHKAGKHLKGKSPFTAEKTPSFYVSPDRGMYYCFSSNQGGDMFTFIQAMEGVDFKGALKILADKTGVELIPEDPKKRSEREQKYEAMEIATKFYEEQLSSASGEAARTYLTKRGVTDKTKKIWRIGLAPDDWRQLKSHLDSGGFTETIERAAGLIKGEKGKEPYDVFRDRIMFPIFDASSRVVAFSGRTLSSDPETPKYVNSPETELFNKSEILYGYDKAKNGIRKFDFTLIVEGQFDVVLAHQAGYNNAVAVSGTALTIAHVNVLGRLSTRVVLALDADRAGLAAVTKAANLMLPRGMDVKVAALPEGQDPADIIQADPAHFKKVIGQSVPVIEHLLRILKKTSRDERALGIAISEELLPLVALIPSTIEHDYFIGVIAKETSIGKDALRQEMYRIVEYKKRQQTSETKTSSEALLTSTAAVKESRPHKFIEHLALYVLLPDLFETVDTTKHKKLFKTLTKKDLEMERVQVPLEVEIAQMESFKKQNPNPTTKERQEHIMAITHNMYRSFLDNEIAMVKQQAKNSEEAAVRIFELRKAKESSTHIEVDLFA